MIAILIIFGSLFVIAVSLIIIDKIRLKGKEHSWTESFPSGLAWAGIWSAPVTLLFFIIILVVAIGASNRAQYLNKRFDKNYTAEEVFWNGSIIQKEILEIKDWKGDLNIH